MNNQEMMNWWFGYVIIQIRGKKLERLINRMMNQRFAAWDIKRISADVAQVSMTLNHFFNLRVLLKETGCKARIIEKVGLPFTIKRVKRRMGLFLGMTAFGVLLFLFSSMIWTVEVEGVKLPENEQAIKQELAKIGVKPGVFKFRVNDYKTIQRKIMEVLPNTTWVGFQFNGTVAKLKVVEKTLPEIKDPPSPRHLVAKKKAIIYNLFVEQGKPMVKPNQYVRPGDILISGVIGTEDHPKIVPATGEVWGEVWYEGNITIPFVQKKEVLTGEFKKEYYVSFGSFPVKVWGYGNIPFETYDTDESEYRFTWKNWSFPLAWKVNVVKGTDQVQHKLTEKQAVQLAVELVRAKMMRKLPSEAEIKEENVLRKRVENGKVYIKMHYTVIEEIASEQFIIQGD